MPRKFNQKCYDCGQVLRSDFVRNRPSCYNYVNCRRVRSHYRNYEVNLLKQHRWHAYKKFQATECFVCGSNESLECHHIEARHVSMKDTIENVITLCHSCHKVVTVLETKLGINKKDRPRWMVAQEKYPDYVPSGVQVAKLIESHKIGNSE
jgi:5-methylcytosine-specific restriction endonuclease McrA